MPKQAIKALSVKAIVQTMEKDGTALEVTIELPATDRHISMETIQQLLERALPEIHPETDLEHDL